MYSGIIRLSPKKKKKIQISKNNKEMENKEVLLGVIDQKIYD